MKRFTRVSLTAPLLMACFLAWTGCKDNPVEDEPTKAVDFVLNDLDGNRFKLSDHYGKVILLDFFAVDDTTNDAQIPAISQIYDAHKDEGLVVVGISTDSEAELDSVVDRYDLAYPVLVDSLEQVSNVYIGQYPLPGIYLFGKDATLQGAAVGSPKTFAELEKAVTTLL